MAKNDALEALYELGFNALEGEVYVFLLSSPPTTAYQVGRSLGRPTANVYKAVESLSRRGAVLVEEGEQRACRAVPISELSLQLERGFKRSLDHAKLALADLETAPPDERVYRIESVPRLFERCEEMLARAMKVAIVDAFPGALERIRSPIIAACQRGVEVLVEAYAPIEIPGARLVVFPRGDKTLETWRSEQLNVVVDGSEHLMALLTADLGEIRQAVWSNSLYLSCIHHAGRLCEHTLVRMLSVLEEKPDEALRILHEHQFFINGEVPGQQELVARLTPARGAKARQKSRGTS